jgi:hypothetical protein
MNYRNKYERLMGIMEVIASHPEVPEHIKQLLNSKIINSIKYDKDE